MCCLPSAAAAREAIICDPVTLTVVAVAGTVLTAGSQMYAADAQQNALQHQAKVADINRKIELNKRADVEGRRSADQLRHWRQVSQRVGLQRAQLAASGVDVNFGSALDVQADTNLIGYEDSHVINQNAMQEFRGLEINAMNYKNQAAAARANAKGVKVGGYLSAGGTLLAGASQVAGIWKPTPGATPAGAG